MVKSAIGEQVVNFKLRIFINSLLHRQVDLLLECDPTDREVSYQNVKIVVLLRPLKGLKLFYY